MSNRLEALTKRALERQLMAAGSGKKAAERITADKTHAARWQLLPLLTRARILLETRND